MEMWLRRSVGKLVVVLVIRNMIVLIGCLCL